MLARLLRRAAARLDCVELRLGWHVAACGQDAAGVSVEVENGAGHRESLHGSYLLGCDGGHGRVRRQLGIRMEGRGRLINGLGIVLRRDALRPWTTLGRAIRCRVINPDGSAVMGPFDGSGAWFFQLHVPPGRDYGERDVRRLIAEAIGGEVPGELLDVTV